MSVGIVLVTGRNMPIADVEGPLIAELVVKRGVSAEVHKWGAGDWSGASLVVVRSTWDYTDSREEFLAWTRDVAVASRLVNPAPMIEWNSHKEYLLELEAAGIPVVPTKIVRLGAPTAEQRAALSAFDELVVVKPAVGAGARGAMRGRHDDPGVVEHVESLTAHGDVLVQPFLHSIAEVGETSLVFFDDELSHAVRKLPAPGDYRIHEHLGGSTIAYAASSAEVAVARAALKHVPVDEPLAYARVDLVEVDGEPAVMELEIIEPYLYLEYATGSADRFADVLVARFMGSRSAARF